MAKEDVAEEGIDQDVDAFESNPESLRDADEISDAEEAFMEGYESGLGDETEEEKEKEEKQDDFDI